MLIEKIETGKFLIDLTEDENLLLHSVCQKTGFTQETLIARWFVAALNALYNLLYSCKIV